MCVPSHHAIEVLEHLIRGHVVVRKELVEMDLCEPCEGRAIRLVHFEQGGECVEALTAAIDSLRTKETPKPRAAAAKKPASKKPAAKKAPVKKATPAK